VSGQQQRLQYELGYERGDTPMIELVREQKVKGLRIDHLHLMTYDEDEAFYRCER